MLSKIKSWWTGIPRKKVYPVIKTHYLVKKVAKYYGLQGCTYYKRVVHVRENEYRNITPTSGWFEVSEERYNKIKEKS